MSFLACSVQVPQSSMHSLSLSSSPAVLDFKESVTSDLADQPRCRPPKTTELSGPCLCPHILYQAKAIHKYTSLLLKTITILHGQQLPRSSTPTQTKHHRSIGAQGPASAPATAPSSGNSSALTPEEQAYLPYTDPRLAFSANKTSFKILQVSNGYYQTSRLDMMRV